MRVLSAVPDVVTHQVAETQAIAARTPVYLAAGEIEETGRYFTGCSPTAPSTVARNEDLAARSRERSAELVGLD